MTDTPDLIVEQRADGVLWLTLNRPDSLNALSRAMTDQLAAVLQQCERDPAVRCVVLTGAGRGFCSGGDVREQAKRREAAAAAAATARAPLPASFEAEVADIYAREMATSHVLYSMGKPVIAAVNGPAAGAGLSLALACDLRIASDRARFTTAFRNVGLSGDFGGSFFLSRLVGEGRAREMYFTGVGVDAAEAGRIGLVNRVVPHEELEAEALAFARQIADGPVGSYARMKRAFATAAAGDLAAVLHQEAVNMTVSGLGVDAREAARAFVEKRKPDFLGIQSPTR